MATCKNCGNEFDNKKDMECNKCGYVFGTTEEMKKEDTKKKGK